VARRLHTDARCEPVRKVERVVLLVEPESELLLTGNALRRADYEVHTARSASGGAKSRSRRLTHLMLLDSKLPRMDGLMMEQLSNRVARLRPWCSCRCHSADACGAATSTAPCLTSSRRRRGQPRLDARFRLERLEFEGDPD